MIHDTVFQNNTAVKSGGGIVIYHNSSLIIEGGSLINNSVTDELVGTGGGLAIRMNSTAIISSAHLLENKGQIRGGAIHADSVSQVTVFNCSFVNNTIAISVGGSVSLQMDYCRILKNSKAAVIVISSSSTITNTRFSHNVYGALYIQSTNSSFHNCSFTDNSAVKRSTLTAVNSNVQFIGCNFTRNSATSDGDVFWLSGNVLLRNCVVTNNTANDGDGGVGYLEEHSHINITTSIFNNNSADGSGGVFRIRNSTCNVWNSSFVNNRAGSYGGAIYAHYFSAINISQTSYYGNVASVGRALYGRAATVFVNDSTMHHNSAYSCSTMFIECTSILKISFSQAHINSSVSLAGAFCAFDNSLLVSKSSRFEGNRGNYERLLTLNSSTGYLENCTLIGNHGIKATAIITFVTSELRLSHTAVFLKYMRQQVVAMQSLLYITKFLNRLYTYESLMKHGNVTLKTDTNNFKQIAIRDNYLREGGPNFPNTLTTEETQFASSEFSVPKFISFCSQLLRIG